MKKILVTLSSLTTLTIAGNSIINNPSTVSSLKLKTQNTQVLPKTSLFNYQYGLLSSDPSKPPENTWITNQSSKDHKIYSYNLQPVIGGTLSDGTKMEHVFIVDEDGNLDYNREIPTIDKLILDNSKAEMIEHRKVTTIKDDYYSPYSCSKYDGAGYFTDQAGVNTWQYLQQGQAAPNIDISHEKNTSNIKHRHNESEALGLYYIVKQSRAKVNRIDLAVADQIAETFIAKSSLKATLNKDLIDQIVTLINKNDNVFSFIANVPFHIGSTYKDYALKYIFDHDNNLIGIYYYHWTNINNIVLNLNYHWSDWFSGFASSWTDNSSIHPILNWKKYTYSWETFVDMYPLFSSTSSNITITNIKGTHFQTSFKMVTSQINTSQTLFFEEYESYDGGTGGFQITSMKVYIWHDDQNIYWQCHESNSAAFLFVGSSITINLKDLTFYRY